MEAKGEKSIKKPFWLIMCVYLLGLVVGGLYVGMVAPVRTVIQEEFSIGNEQGIWIITIYALFYASFIPVIGKVADRRGRKPVFLFCMAVFCLGAAICGASGTAVSLGILGSQPAPGPEAAAVPSSVSDTQLAYVILLAGRVLQAIGACGIIPLANAEIGTAAPEGKRGFALGITAAASGLANVLGAGVGSAIIAIVGPSQWPVLFYACIPFGIIAILGGIAALSPGQQAASGKIDALGSLGLIVGVFLLLLGIQYASSGDASDLPLLGDLVVDSNVGAACLFAGSAVFLLMFVFAERRATDPILPARYFASRPVLITLGVSFLIGGMINSMTLVPEFAEAALGLPVGSGGIYMVVIGVFSMAGPPLGGRFIDKFGPKPVLLAGLAVAACGYLLLAFVAAPHPSAATILLGLAVMGMGLGFCMGAPVNYMILQNVPESESNTAISAVTLVRQVGLSIAPAVYVAFITTGHGGIGYAPLFMGAAAFTVTAFILMLAYRER